MLNYLGDFPRKAVHSWAFTGIVWACLLCGVNSLSVQEVRLGQLLEKASQTHPLIQQASSQMQAAEFEIESAKWGRFPSISTEIRSAGQFSQSFAKVEQPLWTGGRIEVRMALSEVNFLFLRRGYTRSG
jgi:adhesin transport system outer membrane protein